MMKVIFFEAVLLFLMLENTEAQWTINGANIYNSNSGNVGIGIVPQSKLDVNGNIRGTNFVSNISSVTDNFVYDGKSFNQYSTSWLMDSWYTTGATAWFSGFGGIKFFTGGSPKVFINFSGNVGIGTISNNNYKLTVEGTIAARQIKVTSSATWADYVFDHHYNLPALSIVEKFINQNKHLPDIPSAKEVAKQGINLGDNQVALLRKIEELTLYAIEQNKKLEAQQQKIEELNFSTLKLIQANDNLNKRLKKLENKKLIF